MVILLPFLTACYPQCYGVCYPENRQFYAQIEGIGNNSNILFYYNYIYILYTYIEHEEEFVNDVTLPSLLLLPLIPCVIRNYGGNIEYFLSNKATFSAKYCYLLGVIPC